MTAHLRPPSSQELANFENLILKTAQKLTNIQSSDFSLYFKVSKLSHDPEFKMIKLDGDGKISANDMVWPKIRFMLKQLKEKTDKLEVSFTTSSLEAFSSALPRSPLAL